MGNVVQIRRNKRKAPAAVNGKVPPLRVCNKTLRPREHLTPDEVDKLMTTAAKLGRHGPRDATLLLMAYRHGLRVSELVALRWDQIDFKHGLLHVNRSKAGLESTHPLHGPQLRALRALKRAAGASPYVFITERGGPLTTATVRKLMARAGKEAGLSFSVHPHMLRHATGYKLANDGHDTRSIQHYLGHRSIQSTARYTALAPDRFKGFWKD